MVADGREDGERAQQRAGDVEEALPIALVAAAVDEVAGEDGEVGLLVGERVVERGVHVVAGAHVAVDGEAQRAAGVGRRVEGDVADVAAVVEADAIVVDRAGLEPAQAEDVVHAERVARGGAVALVAAPAHLGGGGDGRVEHDGDLALAQAGEVGAAHEARAVVAAERELDAWCRGRRCADGPRRRAGCRRGAGRARRR